MGYTYVHNVTLHITISYILKKERSTTIPNGSTSEANADGSSVQSQD